jgi:hypothetical protein
LGKKKQDVLIEKIGQIMAPSVFGPLLLVLLVSIAATKASLLGWLIIGSK